MFGNNLLIRTFSEVNLSKKIAFLRDLSGQKKLFRLFDAKEQIKLLHHFTSVFLEGSYEVITIIHLLFVYESGNIFGCDKNKQFGIWHICSFFFRIRKQLTGCYRKHGGKKGIHQSLWNTYLKQPN